MTGKKWAGVWLLVQSLLLISAIFGVPFGFFHNVLAGACVGFNIAVYRRMKVVP